MQTVNLPSKILPPEINLQILHHALTSPEPLSFCPLPFRHLEPTHFERPHRKISTLRLALLNRCTKDEPIAKELMTTFSNLSLVSKEVRSLTRSIFFGKNKWVLHVTQTFDAVDWICKHWGREVLGLMRHVRIEAQVFPGATIEALEILVREVESGRRLRTLAVQWLQRSRFLQCALSARSPSDTWHFHPMDRAYGSERNCKRGRGFAGSPEEEADHCYEDDDPYESEGSEREDWKEKEVVLIPLGRLRGIGDVRIEGTVTEQWALWLERAAMSRMGEEVEAFEFTPRAREYLLELGLEPL